MRKRFWMLCLLTASISMAALATESGVALPGSEHQPENRQYSCLEGAFCSTNQDCYNCSGFATASCVDNQCTYTYGSPGGPGGPGGGPNPWDFCLQLPCDTWQDCPYCIDDNGVRHFPMCVSGVCRY